MTNHPRRQRDDLTPEPDAPMADLPPAHTPNGAGEAYKPDAARLIGDAVGHKIAGVLADLLPRALAQVLATVPVRTVPSFKCATCLTGRLAWVNRHPAELAEAERAMLEATAAWPADHPGRAQLNLLMFLPPQFQPSPDPAHPNPEACPHVQPGDVMLGGTVYCAQHVPGIQQAAGGRKEFLIAHSALTPGLIAEVMGQGQSQAA